MGGYFLVTQGLPKASSDPHNLDPASLQLQTTTNNNNNNDLFHHLLLHHQMMVLVLLPSGSGGWRGEEEDERSGGGMNWLGFVALQRIVHERGEKERGGGGNPRRISSGSS
jgi:hypothetical protein